MAHTCMNEWIQAKSVCVCVLKTSARVITHYSSDACRCTFSAKCFLIQSDLLILPKEPFIIVMVSLRLTKWFMWVMWHTLIKLHCCRLCVCVIMCLPPTEWCEYCKCLHENRWSLSLRWSKYEFVSAEGLKSASVNCITMMSMHLIYRWCERKNRPVKKQMKTN